MRHLLDSSALATGGADDTSLALSATAQHTLGLHALDVLVAADVSGSVALGLGESGVLGAILDSLGSGTTERLHAPPNLLRESLALTEAHFMFLQVRCPSCDIEISPDKILSFDRRTLNH